MTLIQVLERIRASAPRATTELVLQDAIAEELFKQEVQFSREHLFDPRNRADFYLPDYRAVLELKIDGGPSDILRQLLRYAEFSEVETLVLVTTKARHRSLPRELNGKPVHVMFLWEGALR